MGCVPVKPACWAMRQVGSVKRAGCLGRIEARLCMVEVRRPPSGRDGVGADMAGRLCCNFCAVVRFCLFRWLPIARGGGALVVAGVASRSKMLGPRHLAKGLSIGRYT